jgi:hypothetical protein
MKKSFLVFTSVVMAAAAVFAQQQNPVPVVVKPVYFDVSPPLRDMVKSAPSVADNTWKDGVVKNFFNVKQRSVQDQGIPQYNDPGLQDYMGQVLTDTTIQNFDGVSNVNGYVPPDTHGDVGPNHYFQVVNASYAVYNKSGVKLIGPFNNSTVWSGMPNNSNDGDAVVLYDEQANRWLFTQFSLPNFPSGPFYQMIAVSTTADPTGTWYRWQYSFTDMPDYPKFGIWPDGYYMSINRFTSGSLNYAGTGAAAFDRTAMIAGNTSATMVYFTLPSSNDEYSQLPSDCDGPFPTAGTPNYFSFIYDASPYHLGIREFHVNWTVPANSTFAPATTLSVNSFSSSLGSGITQKGTSKKLDAISDRLMYRLQYRKFNTYQSMVTCHSVNIGSGVAGIRWYELRNTGSGWSVYQQSTFGPTDNNSRWMGSIAMDSSGNIALGYSVSGSNLYPSIRYTGRMKNDALNTMTISERGIINGGGSQTGGGTPGRWGDYSAMSVDPSATATFWYTTEYYSTTSSTNWKTRVGSFSFANTMTIDATATPPTVTSGQSTQLNVTATGGTGIYTYSWTSIPAGFTSNIQNPVAWPVNTTKYIAAVTSGTNTLTDTAKCIVTIVANATATPSTIIIGQNSQLNVTGTGGTGTYTYSWTSIPAGFTSNIQNPVVSPTVNTKYVAHVIDPDQNVTDTTEVIVTLGVVATATPSSITPGGSSQLNAAASGGTGIYSYLWTSIPPGFTSNIQNPVVYPTATTDYIATVTSGPQNADDTVTVTVTLNPLVVQASATPSSICAGQTSQLYVSASGGSTNYTYSWTSIPPGFTSNLQNPQAQPSVTTQYIAAVNDGTQTVTDTATVYVTPGPIAFAGSDTLICIYLVQLDLNGVASNYSAVEWSTSGDGTFTNTTSLLSTYYPGLNDRTTGNFDLSLTAYPQSPCTNSHTHTRHVAFDPCTGIDPVNENIFGITLQPNPASGMTILTVRGVKGKEFRISMTDMRGNTVMDEMASSAQASFTKKFSLSGFVKGIYLVKVQNGQEERTEKLVVR